MADLLVILERERTQKKLICLSTCKSLKKSSLLLYCYDIFNNFLSNIHFQGKNSCFSSATVSLQLLEWENLPKKLQRVIVHFIRHKWASLQKNKLSLESQRYWSGPRSSKQQAAWADGDQTVLRGPECHRPHRTMCWLRERPRRGDCTVVSHRGTASLMTGGEKKREGEEQCAYTVIYFNRILHLSSPCHDFWPQCGIRWLCRLLECRSLLKETY